MQEKLRWLWQSPERFKPGRGNFLYFALECLKDIEHQVNLERPRRSVSSASTT